MLIQIIIKISFCITKTLFRITKKCLNGTLNADLLQGEGYNVSKRCERAEIRFHLIQLALRGFKGGF